LQELAYVPSSNPKAKTLQEGDEHTDQQHKNDPLKVTNASEIELDQLDTRLVRYGQNCYQTLLLKMSNGHIRPWTGYDRSRWIYLVKLPDMSDHPETFFATLILEL
jgi:hypothetical protein